jgi:hypothetical protein
VLFLSCHATVKIIARAASADGHKVKTFRDS